MFNFFTKKSSKNDIHRVLYMYEFMVFPDLFLNSKEDSEYNFLLLQDLTNKREEFFKMYNNGKFGDFTYRDFKVNKIVKEIELLNFLIIQIVCPQLKESPLCKYIYVVNNEALNNPRYFTIEYSFLDSFILGEKLYDKNGDDLHMNYGEIEDDIEIQIERILEMYNE